MRTTCRRLLLPAALAALALLAPAARAEYEKPADEPGCWTVRDLGGKRGSEFVICPTNVEAAIVKLCKDVDYKVPCIGSDDDETNDIHVLHIVIPTNHEFQCHLDGGAHKALTDWIGAHTKNASLRIVAGRVDGGADGADGTFERFTVAFDGGGDASGKDGRPIFDLSGCRTTDDNDDNFHARFIGCTFQNVTMKGDGGAVRGNVNCSFRSCTFTGLTLNEDGSGGAIYCPAQADDVDDTVAFTNLTVYAGKDVAQDCTFFQCKAYDAGGAIYKTKDSAVIRNCTFTDCSVTENDDDAWYGAGGALSFCGTNKYCVFRGCTTDKGHGGAAYACRAFISCLFENCQSKGADYMGGAVCNGATTYTEIYYCTFINCTDNTGAALYERSWVPTTKVYNSIFHKCTVGHVSESKGCSVIKEGDSDYFFDFTGGNYHFNRCEEDGSGGYSRDPVMADRNYMPADEGYLDAPGQGFIFSDTSISGCYRYYTKEEWIEWIKDRGDPEYLNHDPLTVTTSGWSRGPKDYKISFAEALRYASDPKCVRYTKHPGVITFDLDASHREVAIDALEGASIAATNLAALAIAGGDLGITLRNAADSTTAVRFACPLAATNVTFALLSPSVELSDAAGKSVTFANCVHAAGDGAGGMRFDFSGAGGRVAFESCTISGFAEGAGPVFCGEGHRATFDACTFTGNAAGTGLSWEGAWAADFVNCTAVLGSRDRTFAAAGGATRLFNCILANCTGVAAGVATDHTAVAEDLKDVFANVEPESQTVFGVGQTGYRPRHGETARNGAAESADGALKASPRDVFGHPQEGRRQSQGSYFVDDVENPSLTVTIAADIEDAYDDQVSFREAVAYAGAYGTSFKLNSRLTPVFDPAVFPDGKVTLELKSAVTVDNAVFSLYPFELRPAKGQQLVITAPDSADGALVFATGTKGEISETTFRDCAGGAILNDGKLRILHTLFTGCTAPDAGGALFLGENAETLCYDVTFAECRAGTAGGAVFNQGVFRALNVSLIGNGAPSGSAVASHKAQETLFANAEMVDNTASAGGVTFYVEGTGAGLVNSIVAGNSGAGVSADQWAPAPDGTYVPEGNYYAYSLVSGTKAEVFSRSEPVAVTDDYGVTLLSYPLRAGGPADNAGAFLFTDGFLDIDGRETASDLGAIYYSPDPEPAGYIDPLTGDRVRPRTLYGETRGLNGLVLRDMFGGFIEMDEHGMGTLPGGAVKPPEPADDGVTVLRPYDPTDVDTSDILRPWPVWAPVQVENGRILNEVRTLMYAAAPAARNEAVAVEAAGVEAVAVQAAGVEATPVWYQGVALPEGIGVLADGAQLNGASVRVTKLPGGVKFDRKTGTLKGTPKKAGDFKISIRVGSGRAAQTVLREVTVSPLPAWAVGNFDGALEGGATVSLSVGKNGRITGKTQSAGLSTTLRADSFSAVRTEDGAYLADLTVKYRDPQLKRAVSAVCTAVVRQDPGTGLGTVEFQGAVPGAVTAVQRGWERRDLALPAFAAGRSAPSLETADGLTVRFGAKGAVTVKGTLAGDNGAAVSVSCKTKALLCGADGNLLVVTVPVFVRPRRGLEGGFSAAYRIGLEIGASGGIETARELGN